MISNNALRKAFLASGLSPNEVARRCEWFRTFRRKRDGRVRRSPDGSLVRRALGLKPCTTHGCYRYTYKQINYERAVQIAEAIGADPQEVNL